jgi:DNA-binding protein HU-beta
VNKAQLVEALAERLGGDKKNAATAIDGMLDTIIRAVAKGEKVAITGFGVFEKRDRAARTARNPATGEKVRVKKTSVPAFRAGQGFKDVVSGSKKLPKVTGTKAGAKKAPAKATKAAGTGAATKATAKKTVAKKAATKAPATKRTASKAPAKKTTARKTTRGR